MGIRNSWQTEIVKKNNYANETGVIMGKILKYAFRITHIDNISHIVQYGLVRENSPHRDEHFVSIGDQQIIKLRGEMDVKGYRISNYIPFYLGPRSPMLYVIQHGYNGVQRVERKGYPLLFQPQKKDRGIQRDQED